jgi:hypothetical protein
MPHYLVNDRAQPTGEHEVHETICSHLPDSSNRRPLGWHADCHSAVRAARQIYANSDGCAFCCPACHRK